MERVQLLAIKQTPNILSFRRSPNLVPFHKMPNRQRTPRRRALPQSKALDHFTFDLLHRVQVGVGPVARVVRVPPQEYRGFGSRRVRCQGGEDFRQLSSVRQVVPKSNYCQ